MRLLIFIFIICSMWSHAETNLVTRTFHIGDADPEEMSALFDAAKSPEGRVIIFPSRSKVTIQDTPEVMEIMEQIAREAAKPLPLIRVELTLRENQRDSRSGVELWGQSGVVIEGNRARVRPVERNILGANIQNDSRTSSSLSSQFLLLKSGRSASIKVGEDVPFVDYFWSYAYDLGILYDTQVRWESIGTQMRVYATARGNLIDIEIVPEITALTGDAFAPVSFRSLATQVTLRNGESIDIGGFNKADDEFNRHFFFGTRSQSSLTGTFTLKAQIQ